MMNMFMPIPSLAPVTGCERSGYALYLSIVVVNCGHRFSRASAARQSHSCRQYRTSSFR